MVRTLISFAALAAAGAAAAAPLQFGTLDLDADGNLSRQELEHHSSIASRFDALDSDRSGFLSSKEFSAFEAKPADSETKGGADAKGQKGGSGSGGNL